MMEHNNTWVWSLDHHQAGRVVDTQTLWGQTICRVWFPQWDTVVRVSAERLRPLAEAAQLSPEAIAYLAIAARVAEALTQDVLLAPIEASVIPLPHQIRALSRALAGDRIRYLLADEVGLGKTIEAGLIVRELKQRGLAQRILVVAPKGLVAQWVAEMRTHFNEDFRLVLPVEFENQIDVEQNLWRQYPQVICPLDSVKPLDGRRGWSAEQLAEHNRRRFDDLVGAGWDLIIVDEAHRLGGSTDQVARFRLGQGLAQAAPYLLLLSATPHQGKTDAFHRLVSLLDADAFPTAESVSKETVKPYVIRTAKRNAIDAQGQPLFKPRQTQLWSVAWEVNHPEQRRLYEAVTEYVREGYNQAVQAKKSYIGFLMILMQRLVTSSTRAIQTTLERRLEALRLPDEQLALFPAIPEEEWAELDSQEQVEAFVRTRLRALQNEQAEVELLLALAQRAEQAGPDPKAQALLDWIYRLQRETGDAELKVLVFTEFVPTQAMLRGFLTERGFKVAVLNGSMSLEERQAAQTEFAELAQILVSTDAGGEGLNLQFCHVVVNYDIPWNPMRLEQRIGRVDRIGQTHAVRAINFVLAETVEYRVQEVLEEKLKVILQEFGVDKTSDVLDSAQAETLFDELYVEALLRPEQLADKLTAVLQEVRAQAQVAQATADTLSTAEPLNPAQARQMLETPLPHWVEHMTVNYLRAYGGQAEKRGTAWTFTWPSGEVMPEVVFRAREAEAYPSARRLSLEDPFIRDLALHLPPFVNGQPIPQVTIPGLSADVRGVWALWRVALNTPEQSQQRMLALFVNETGRVFLPTARRIWEQLLMEPARVLAHATGASAEQLWANAWATKETQGQAVYDELLQAHRARLDRDRAKGEAAFAARRRAIERIGLPAVRQHRLGQLTHEEQAWREQLEARAHATPEVTLVLLLQVGTLAHV